MYQLFLIVRGFTSSCFVDYFVLVIAIHCATPIVSTHFCCNFCQIVNVRFLWPYARYLCVGFAPACLSTNPYFYFRLLLGPNKAFWQKNGLIPKSESDETKK